MSSNLAPTQSLLDEKRTSDGLAADTIVGAPSTPIVHARGLGKCYRVYERPQDRLKQALLRGRRTYYREFWALRDVSLSVERGAAVGILGRNGSGKSTLLQLIAGILAPSEGSVEVRGRVAAMLELGSGFNPEFTGRENVFLQGAILGITKHEMETRFDDIAAFADIGAFIDQPLKTYSSGMVARLAFAVSFSVDPDVMIVDEILAVGDIGFQARCLARFRQLRDKGLTLLFVSHSPDAVRSLCDQALFLIEGKTAFVGGAERATDVYLAHVREEANRTALLHDGHSFSPHLHPAAADTGPLRYGSGHVRIETVQLTDRDGAPCRAFRLGDPITLEVTMRSREDVRDLSVSFLVRDMTGIDLMGTTTFDEHVTLPVLPRDRAARVRFSFENRLRPGSFGVSVAVTRVSRRDYGDVVVFDQVDGCIAFTVIGDPERPVHYKFHHPVDLDWEILSDGT
jgi:lipopolysaccharide transport system ATP-binding protein